MKLALDQQRHQTKLALDRVAQLESWCSRERSRFEQMTNRIAELEKQLADEKAEQVWFTTLAVSRNINQADTKQEEELAEVHSPNVRLTRCTELTHEVNSPTSHRRRTGAPAAQSPPSNEGYTPPGRMRRPCRSKEM
jgi:hypothetical protein